MKTYVGSIQGRSERLSTLLGKVSAMGGSFPQVFDNVSLCVVCDRVEGISVRVGKGEGMIRDLDYTATGGRRKG